MVKLTKSIFVTMLLLCLTAFDGQPLLRQQQQQHLPAHPIHTNSEDHPHIIRAMFTTRIDGSEPVSDLIEIETHFTQIFFFTELMECGGCTVAHKWYHNGVFQFESNGYSDTQQFKYWSSATLDPSFVGQWTVEASINGGVAVEREFTYFIPTQVQQKTRGIQQRIEEQSLTECQYQLRHFSEQVRQYPNEQYYKFMFDKWSSRCVR